MIQPDPNSDLLPPVEPQTPEIVPAKPAALGQPNWVYELLLALVLVVAAVLRLVGTNWGEYTYLHPDERFLIWVGADIQPIGQTAALGAPPNSSQSGMDWRKAYIDVYRDCSAWGGYFDTGCSPLNPHNRGHTFYVYGTFPMFMARYLAEWTYGHSGFSEMTDIGRPLSAVADLLSVLLVFLIAERLFGKPVGLLAAAFSAAAVLQIQQAHFFTMDTFANLFTFLAFYLAVLVMKVQVPEMEPFPDSAAETETLERQLGLLAGFVRHPYFGLSLGFGVALGMAVASKINVAVVALILPAALLVRLPSIPKERREAWMVRAFAYLVLAAITSLLVFRLLQPYAFSGPGFFGLKPNPLWVANILEQRNQAAGDVDFPPALQWARRTPVWFALKNLVAWGLGLPLGLLAAAGFFWAGWKILRGDWKEHALLWSWTALYFAWQAPTLNPTMRYFLPIYPTLAIFAAWLVGEVYRWGQAPALAAAARGGLARLVGWLQRRARLLAWLVGGGVLVGVFIYAFAFLTIYTRPITRVDASRWIFQNIPGPINLQVQNASGGQNQPISMPYNYSITSGTPYGISFSANFSGTLQTITLGHALDPQKTGPENLQITLSALPQGSPAISTTQVQLQPAGPSGSSIQSFVTPVEVSRPGIYYLNISNPAGDQPVNLCGEILVFEQTGTTLQSITLPSVQACVLTVGQVTIPFQLSQPGSLTGLYIASLAAPAAPQAEKTLSLKLQSEDPTQPALATASLSSAFEPGWSGLGDSYTFTLSQPLQMRKGASYRLTLSLTAGDGGVQISGAGLANEGEWDDGLPLRVDGYDGFGGIYPTGLNFNMYWEENDAKRERFKSILDQSDYIVITSSRQWGSLPRLPERFPMSTAYYRALVGCPLEKTIEWCYSVAKPGVFQGSMGFKLVKIFESDPQLGPFSTNDQFAEEAFTVYDHPKVLIFAKTPDYKAETMHAFLDAVDLTKVIHLTPKKAGSYPADLMLPPDRLAVQTAGGTWADLFDPSALQNSLQVIGLLAWYLAVFALGLLVFPLVRLALPELPDQGYPLSRTIGMLLLALVVWLAGSFGLAFDRLSISLALLAMAVLGGVLAYHQRAELANEWHTRRGYYLRLEALFLAFFVLFLLVRLGNPDLWHPWKGGEKPMDFSYFNAVLKSTTFPPYDPWFAGGYLNYYYYGFVFSGVLVKWLGILPSIAYNFILPTMFALTAIGAFSIAWNLAASLLPGAQAAAQAEGEAPPAARRPLSPWIAGLAAALLMVVLGNLGTLRMIFRGYQILVDPTLAGEGANLVTRWIATFQGIGKVLAGQSLPYGIGDWYWNPSRVMPPGDNAITEFPAFTFIYADPHAHLFALPIALAGLAWAVGVMLGKGRWKNGWAFLSCLFVGGLAIGALRPTNTWDFPTYLLIGLVVLGYTLWRYLHLDPENLERFPLLRGLKSLPAFSLRLLATGGGLAGLLAFSVALYQPFATWYGQAYTKVQLWTFPVTPLNSYFTHWGLFLFIIGCWLAWETLDWMSKTPASSLRKINWEAAIGITIMLAFFALLLAFKMPGIENQPVGPLSLFGRGVGVALVVIPLGAWAGVLLLRPGLPDAKRFVLFLTGTALLITLVVELVVLSGDIGRQNTVFKLYLQAWTLLAICSGAALLWLFEAQEQWSLRWSTAWQVALFVLVGSAALFPVLAASAKIKDRMVQGVPLTLDGMAYMQYAHYLESDDQQTTSLDMDLSQDYAAIQWMQENVKGSPVIVEANSGRLYRWYSRFTIYTGLPGVVGWEWHQQQQRGLVPGDWVSQRLRDIDLFYRTSETSVARTFLQRYHVKYVIVGQLERVSYPGSGLDKFKNLEGQLWREVYHDRDTVIYEVIE